MSRVELPEHLTRAKVATLAGVTAKTLGYYERQGRLPERDVFDFDGNAIGWTPEVIREWLRTRPGAGARTDLVGGRVAVAGPGRTARTTPEEDVQAARWADVDGLSYTEIAARLGYRQASGAVWAAKRGRKALTGVDPTAHVL